MKGYLIIALMLVLISAEDYYLSPPIPPTAFYGQFYTVQFRVIGLDNAIFTYQNLPTCFIGSTNGTISGIPNIIGSYPVNIYINSAGVFESRATIIRVTSSISSTSTASIHSQANISQSNFVIVGLDTSFTYKVGDQLNFIIQGQNGKKPYTWSYISLPSQLIGTTEGRLSGSFTEVGYYSFSISASDSSGKTADAYFTFNIQPASALSNSPLIVVPNRNSPSIYNLSQVEEQQVAAVNALFAAINIVNQRKSQYTEVNASSAKAALKFKFANAQVQLVNTNVKKLSILVNRSNLLTEQAAQMVATAKKVVLSLSNNYINARSITQNAEMEFQSVQNAVYNATLALNQANLNFISAQTDLSKNSFNTLIVLIANLNARNDYNITYKNLTIAKKTLQQMQNQQAKANNILANAQNLVKLANRINDAAYSDLTVTQNTYTNSENVLNKANKFLSNIKDSFSDSQNQLEIAKLNMQMAMNKLYVAQSAKAEADKAIAIVLTQSVILPTNSASQFAGCDQKAYPMICGSAQITRSSNYGLILSTGDTLLFGSCTSIVNILAVGNFITYNGYLRNGYVQAISILLII